MSTQLDEGQLRFVFGDEWQVERYDRGELGEQGHSYYRNQVSRLPNTKAVDFMALLNGEDVYFIEIKDFRNYRIENKTRLTSGELALEVAHKVRDTLAGLMGATRNESPATILSETTGLIINRTKTVRVVFWFEDDMAVNLKQWEEELNTLTTRIQNLLRWFTPRVLVVSQSTYAHKPPHLGVTNAPLS